MNMAVFSTDIDIDVTNRETIISKINCVQAVLIKNNKRSKHPSGVYFQNAPIHPVDNLCAIDYEEAEKHGFFKIDLLNNHLYNEIKSEDHLNKLLNTEPLWELLENEEIVNELHHINSNFEIVKKIKPKSIEELAIVIALIRPGKRYLLKKNMKTIRSEIWKKVDGYYYKKPHAIAYAASIVVQLNLIVEKLYE